MNVEKVTCGEPSTDGRLRLCLVAAIASNGVIGRQGKLPWHLPEDLKHFRDLTLGHPVIMGRRTWESLGRALPGRQNIMVTRHSAYRAIGATVVDSLGRALEACGTARTAFVIGGSNLYAAALPLADALVITEIHATYEGDVRFPEFDRSRWRETRRDPQRAASGARFDFVYYDRTGS